MPNSDDNITLKAMIDGLDQAARQAEIKWGVERLPLIVDVELRAKFERQRVKTYEALEAAYAAPFLTRGQLDATMAAVKALERGWQALDKAATETRQMPLCAVTTVLEGRTHDGMALAIVATNDEVRHVLHEGRALVVLTVEEVANLLAAVGSVVTDTKRLFPGVKIDPPKFREPDWHKNGDDAIPWD